MKTVAVLALFLAGSNAFVVPTANNRVAATTSLNAEIGRRQFATVAFTAAAVMGTGAAPAFAAIEGRGATYVPKFKDLKLILDLGLSLDRLIAKFENPDTIEAALSGVQLFNRDPKFYPGYAKNYISKSVTNNADADPRIGYIKQACKLVGSTESLYESGLYDDATAKEAISRVKKAQSLIAKFLAESGVQDENVAAFVSAHP